MHSFIHLQTYFIFHFICLFTNSVPVLRVIFLPVDVIYLEFLCYLVYMFCSFDLILYIIRFYSRLSFTPFYYFDYL